MFYSCIASVTVYVFYNIVKHILLVPYGNAVYVNFHVFKTNLRRNTGGFPTIIIIIINIIIIFL